MISKRIVVWILALLLIFASAAALADAAETWTCPNCGTASTGNFCPQCGAAKPAAPKPTPVPGTVFRYRVDQYYFTAVDGVVNSKYDYGIPGEVRATTETSVTVSVPASAYEGYVYYPASPKNLLTTEFDDPTKLVKLHVIYVRWTTTAPLDPTPTPQPTPEPVYKYRVDQYYYTAINGVINSTYDFGVVGETVSTSQTTVTVAAPASTSANYYYFADSDKNILSAELTNPEEVARLQAVYVRWTTLAPTPEPTPQPTPAPTPVPTPVPQHVPGTVYRYRVDQYYFTAVDGVVNSKYDYGIPGEVRATTETSVTVDAPASAYEGYVYYPASPKNLLSTELTDPTKLVKLHVIYVRWTTTAPLDQQPQEDVPFDMFNVEALVKMFNDGLNGVFGAVPDWDESMIQAACQYYTLDGLPLTAEDGGTEYYYSTVDPELRLSSVKQGAIDICSYAAGKTTYDRANWTPIQLFAQILDEATGDSALWDWVTAPHDELGIEFGESKQFDGYRAQLLGSVVTLEDGTRAYCLKLSLNATEQ